MHNSNDSSQTPLLLQVAEVQVKYRNKIPFAERPQINRSQDAEQIFHANWGEDMQMVEEFNVLFVTISNRVKGFFRLGRDGLTGTEADYRSHFCNNIKRTLHGTSPRTQPLRW